VPGPAREPTRRGGGASSAAARARARALPDAVATWGRAASVAATRCSLALPAAAATAGEGDLGGTVHEVDGGVGRLREQRPRRLGSRLHLADRHLGGVAHRLGPVGGRRQQGAQGGAGGQRREPPAVPTVEDEADGAADQGRLGGRLADAHAEVVAGLVAADVLHEAHPGSDGAAEQHTSPDLAHGDLSRSSGPGALTPGGGQAGLPRRGGRNRSRYDAARGAAGPGVPRCGARASG
jgi:hypothetical protein